MKKRVVLLLVFILLCSSIVFAETKLVDVYKCPYYKPAMLALEEKGLLTPNSKSCDCYSSPSSKSKLIVSSSASCNPSDISSKEAVCNELGSTSCGDWVIDGNTVGSYSPSTINHHAESRNSYNYVYQQYVYPRTWSSTGGANDNTYYNFHMWFFVKDPLTLRTKVIADDLMVLTLYKFDGVSLSTPTKQEFTCNPKCQGDNPTIEQIQKWGKLEKGWYLLVGEYVQWGGQNRANIAFGYDPTETDSFQEFGHESSGYTQIYEKIPIINSYGPIPLDGDKSKEYCENLNTLSGHIGTWLIDGMKESEIPSDKLCCGDDASDINYAIGGFRCAKTSTGGKWESISGVDCKDKPDDFNLQKFDLTAKDGSDGCCGNNPNFYNPSDSSGDLGYITPNGRFICLKDSAGKFKWEASNSKRVINVKGVIGTKSYSIDVLDGGYGYGFFECAEGLAKSNGYLSKNMESIKFSGEYANDANTQCSVVANDGYNYVSSIYSCGLKEGGLGDKYQYYDTVDVWFKKLNIIKVAGDNPPADGIIKFTSPVNSLPIQIESENFEIFKSIAFNLQYDDSKATIPQLTTIDFFSGNTKIASVSSANSYSKRGAMQKQPTGEDYPWDYLEIPITSFTKVTGKDLKSVTQINFIFTNNLAGTKIKNLHLEPKDKSRICSNHLNLGYKWLISVNPASYGLNPTQYGSTTYETQLKDFNFERLQNACKYMGFAGTGLKCCGAQAKSESYTGDRDGCYMGYFVRDNSLVSASTGKDTDKDKLYYKGDFIQCTN